MNENIAQFINRTALSEAESIYIRRLVRGSLNEDRQRMKIIQELIELYDAYDLIGCDQTTEILLKKMSAGEQEEFAELYEGMIKDTRRAELADVAIATLTLKIILHDGAFVSSSAPARGRTFIEMIKRVSEGICADAILQWVIEFANTHGINLADQVRIKLYYNGIRKDWEE